MTDDNLSAECAAFEPDTEADMASYGYRLDRLDRNIMSPELGPLLRWWWTLSITRNQDIVSTTTWPTPAEAKADMLRDYRARQEEALRA
jgi:hypothetical protein